MDKMEKKIIDKVLDNQGTQEEARKVAQWFGTPEGQLDAASRMDAEWEALVSERDAREQSAHADDTHVINKGHNIWRYINRVAAVILLILIGGAAFQMVKHYNQPAVEMREVVAQNGEQIKVMLQDGSCVHLNSGSRVSFPAVFKGATRTISLVGEAYFEVSKDARHPFIVDLSDASVEVLGTSFNVSAYDNELLRVSLDEGSVMFHGARQQVKMRPGETLTYNRDDEVAILSRRHDTQLASAWKNHRIEVNEMPMTDLINLLSRRYDVTFVVEDESCYENIYSLSMSDNDLHNVINNMAYVSPVRVNYDAENKVVTIQKKN